MRRLFISVAPVVAGLLTVSSDVGQSQDMSLASHKGSTDPVIEGFTMSAWGNPQLGPVTNDLGLDAWSMEVSAARVHYERALPALDGVDWQLSLVARVLTVGWGGTIVVTTGGPMLGITFGTTPNGDPMAAPATFWSHRPAVVLEGAGPSYHNYELVYSAETRLASFWVDGIKYDDDLAGWEQPFAPTLTWGTSYQNVPGVAVNWHSISLQIIPEPSSLALLGFGGVWLVLRRLKRRQQT